ncbi:polynucleotide adenylyltransferase PcnB [Syntrophotalea carbinolica]|nr:polynucleotide adenylyltransferase PcnB [Syntrophotalea carbinolica]
MIMTEPDKEMDTGAQGPVIVPRSQHSISRKHINEHSLKVLYRLRNHGFKAYLVGGGVRDLLLNRRPKDFDVATDATPSQVKKLFRNCFLVGRRFRLAHIRFAENYVVEVATFRRQPRPEELPDDPAEHFFFTENVFGTPREDAFRRDFSINGLFYNIDDFSVIDHVGGLQDLEARRLRVIGDPLVRFTEDPVRMLRALEFAARLGFSLDEGIREAIYLRGPLIAEAAPARIREEVMELFRHAVAGPVFREAQAMGLLSHLLAGYEVTEETLALLEGVDRRTGKGAAVEESLVLATLFLARFRHALPTDDEATIGNALQLANLLLTPMCAYFRIAHGTRARARDLLIGFFRLSRGRGRRGEARFLRHTSSVQALEFFALWCETTQQQLDLLADWRLAFAGTEAPSAKSSKPSRRRPRRRRRSGQRRSPKPAPKAD